MAAPCIQGAHHARRLIGGVFGPADKACPACTLHARNDVSADGRGSIGSKVFLECRGVPGMESARARSVVFDIAGSRPRRAEDTRMAAPSSMRSGRPRRRIHVMRTWARSWHVAASRPNARNTAPNAAPSSQRAAAHRPAGNGARPPMAGDTRPAPLSRAAATGSRTAACRWIPVRG